MEQFVQYLPSNNVVALIIASLIFIVTVTLVAKKLISFLITIVLLFFAIASGMAIANNDLVRDYFKSISQKTQENPPEHTAETTTQTLEHLRDDVVELFNQLIEVLSGPQKQQDQPQKESTEKGR